MIWNWENFIISFAIGIVAGIVSVAIYFWILYIMNERH